MNIHSLLTLVTFRKIRTSIYMFCISLLFLTLTSYSVFAGSEDLTVTKVTRISHPAYRATNQWYSIRDPWNRNYERVMLYEATQFYNGIAGRGLVWGYVNQLKSWSTLQQYESIAKPLPKANNKTWKSTSVYWSPFSGEENIVYGVVKNDNRLMKVNVDTGAWEAIMSFDPSDGTDLINARGIGWTLDNIFIVNFYDESRSSGGYEINVHAKTKRRYSAWPDRCSPDGRRYPCISHGHSDKSPDGTKYANDYGQTMENGVQNLVNCNFTEDRAFENRLLEPYPLYTNYVSWKASENWYLVCSDYFWEDSNEPTPNWALSSPEIMNYKLWQMNFDGANFSYREILRVKSAAAWDPDDDHTNGNEIWNSHCNLIPVLRKDGKQIWFTMTDNKYSYEDYQARGVTPWGFEGVFLADLSNNFSNTTTTVGDITPPCTTNRIKNSPVSVYLLEFVYEKMNVEL